MSRIDERQTSQSPVKERKHGIPDAEDQDRGRAVETQRGRSQRKRSSRPASRDSSDKKRPLQPPGEVGGH